ncbi:hypothetical protein QAD02_015985 [Eretmocerus hayati]|uniref:Uncharacterized protein n=1 Tax=Eretmocerus hayati TaxID=131215 RepID=A0ACC2P9T4_9HYME|nr:hypothetical protein QAD02_015985 [Eretmocerus hayati]
MDSDLIDMVNEAKEKYILHWNYRGLTEIPEAVKDVGGHVQEVYLKWNKLSTLPPWIGNFTEVTNLYLYGNCIESLPVSLGNMCNLVVLDLSANQLKDLPSSLGSLKNLQSLLLNQNYIRSLPSSLKDLVSLRYLSLSGNQFSALPGWLGSLPNLQELLVDNNSLEELPRRLTLSISLKVISVCSNRLSYLPSNGFASSPHIRFDSNPYLNYLSLPVFYQQLSKSEHFSNEESADAMAYGCFRSNSTISKHKVSLTLTLVPGNSHNEHKEIRIELPRQLLVIHSHYENTTTSLWELSLRRIYSLRFQHILNISLDQDQSHVFVSYKPISTQSCLDKVDLLESCILYNLTLDGPVSICMHNSCNEPIFTEAWVVFGAGRNTLGIPIMVMFCSHRCAAAFVESSNFTKANDLYRIQK